MIDSEIKNLIFFLIFIFLIIKLCSINIYDNEQLNLIFRVITVTALIIFTNSFLKSSNILQNDEKITVIILNFNRPHNLVKSLKILNEYDRIGEIIVSHGKPSTYVEFEESKVKNIKDFELDKLYGSALRFLRALDAKHNIILFLDDDTLPDENTINNTYDLIIKNYHRNTLYGHIGRNCNEKGYFSNRIKNGNVALTPFLMCKKSIMIDYLKDKKIGFYKFKNFFKKYRGNCEDLSLNYFVEKEYLEKPIIIDGDGIKLLDFSNGFSSNSKHRKLRNNFCRYLNFLDNK